MRSITFSFVRMLCAALFLSASLVQTDTVRAQESIPTGIEDNTYTSPIFGYTFNWDDSIWTAGDQLSEDGYDSFYLTSDIATLYIEGMYFYQGDPEQCIEGERIRNAEENDLDDLDPMTDDSGAEFAGSDESSAYGYFSIPSVDDESVIEGVVYIECRVIMPNSAVLVITALLGPDDQGAEDDVQAVVDIIELGIGGEISFDASDLEQIARLSGNDINAYWTRVFSDAGETYVDPLFITFQGPIETECGDAISGESGPFYCPAEQTIYLDIDYFNAQILPFGVIVMQVVIAHEIGHHVQELLTLPGCPATACGEPESSLAIELQADCMAGAWTQDAAARGIIKESDLERVDTATKQYFGDPPGTPKDDPTAHGSGEARDELFQAGFTEGPAGCGFE